MTEREKTAFPGKQRVVFLPISQIRSGTARPRSPGEQAELEELAHSLAEHGILQPISVRRTRQGYALVAGERRLRAARLAGMHYIPCILMDVDARDGELLSLVENLQRRELHFMDEARGLARLMEVYGLRQEEAARHMGKSQSAIANKLRLLRHSPEVQEVLRTGGLTERHARALLQVTDPAQCLALAKRAAAEHWTVARLEEHLAKDEPEAEGRLLRTLLRALQTEGTAACWEQREIAGEIVLTVRLPKSG